MNTGAQRARSSLSWLVAAAYDPGVTQVVLPVGAPVRGRAGAAVFASLAVTVAFCAFTWWAKENTALDLSQPWQDDPYDVLVSLDFAVLPFGAVMIAWRTLLCRRYSVLPARRLVDVLRACSVGVGVCLVTQIGEWVALALGLHHRQWTPFTGLQIGVLIAFTAAAAQVLLLLVSATRRVRRVATAAAAPDWMADLVTLGLLAARRLTRGGALRGAVRFVDTQVSGRVRRHPIAAGALLATALALPFTGAKVVFEGYPPLLVLLSFALPAAVLFAFVMLAGWLLRLVTPTWSHAPRWLPALVVACATGPAVFAFHDSFPTFQTPMGSNVLLFGGALIGAAVTAMVQLLASAGRPRRS